jgi:hypothetical protein
MNEKIQIKCKVKLSLTAYDWQLYDIPGAKAAARSMNAKVAKALNAGDLNGAVQVLYTHSEFGAADSEPLWVLNCIAKKMGFDKEVF